MLHPTDYRQRSSFLYSFESNEYRYLNCQKLHTKLNTWMWMGFPPTSAEDRLSASSNRHHNIHLHCEVLL